MKIVFCTTYYGSYLNAFYAKNPDIGQLSYQELMDRLTADHFGVFAHYNHYANELGSESILIAANCKPLQEKWAQENGIPFNESDWHYSVAIEQIKAYRPDIFFISSMFDYYGEFLHTVKPFCKKIMGWIACPIPDNIDMSPFSLLLTSLTYYADMFRGRGINAEQLLPAFDPRILDSLSAKNGKTTPFSFVGGLSSAHSKRQSILSELCRQTPLKFWGYGMSRPEPGFSLRNLFKPKDPLLKSYQGEAWGLDMYSVLHHSQITFNSHIDIAKDYSVNMRLFEATGVGALLLTEHGQNLSEIFVPDKEVITYKSTAEAIEKVKYYLEHDKERQAIAEAGQKRTLRDYNYRDNVAKLLTYFQKYS